MVHRMASRRKAVTEVIEKDGVPIGEVTMEYIPPTKEYLKNKKIKNKKEPVIEEPIPEPKINYCDLHIVCQKCGSDQTIGKGIEGGLQLIIVPQEDSFVQLNCDKCETSIRLLLVPGEAPVEEDFKVVDTTINEDIPQENKQEESL
jgi:transcription elongation factor Elf1